MFSASVASSPPPWPAPGLAVTPEIAFQSELWLPLELITPAFNRFYRAALRYPPILSSAPLRDATSWAAVVSRLPDCCGASADPGRLLELLLADDELRTRFLCWSFMPRRFYGTGSDRYPAQTEYVRNWLTQRKAQGGRLRCLDAACGDGAAVWALARLLLEQGWRAERFELEGWTLEPLEVWAAAHASFPHDPLRQREYRTSLRSLFQEGVAQRLVFRVVDLEDEGNFPAGGRADAGFDLIICNGLLGGPIINQPRRIKNVVHNLLTLLRPDGLVLVADHFHGGWKKRLPATALARILEACGLRVSEAGEGLRGTR